MRFRTYLRFATHIRVAFVVIAAALSLAPAAAAGNQATDRARLHQAAPRASGDRPLDISAQWLSFGDGKNSLIIPT